MKQLAYEIEINATPEKVWNALWNQENYKIWSNGQRFEGNWEEGTIMKFFDKDNNGMYNQVEINLPQEQLKMKHLGWIYDGKLEPQNWENSHVSYFLASSENGTTLKSEVNSLDEFVGFYDAYFPKIFKSIKEISEH